MGDKKYILKKDMPPFGKVGDAVIWSEESQMQYAKAFGKENEWKSILDEWFFSPNVFYWEKYDDPNIQIPEGFKNDEKFPLPGRWACTDERVKSFEIYGTCSIIPTEKISMMAVLVFKNGDKKDFPLEGEVNENSYEILIEQAEKYLQSLPK